MNVCAEISNANLVEERIYELDKLNHQPCLTKRPVDLILPFLTVLFHCFGPEVSLKSVAVAAEAFNVGLRHQLASVRGANSERAPIVGRRLFPDRGFPVYSRCHTVDSSRFDAVRSIDNQFNQSTLELRDKPH